MSTPVAYPDARDRLQLFHRSGRRTAASVALRRLADRVESAEVERALRDGWSWAEVAEALGVTRQAAHKKHAGRMATAGVDLRRRRG